MASGNILDYNPLDLPSNRRGLNKDAVAELEFWNGFYYSHYQPVNVAREVKSVQWWQVWGRPMGNYNTGPQIVNTPQNLAGNWPDRAWPSGSPLSILSWAKTQAANLMRGPQRV